MKKNRTLENAIAAIPSGAVIMVGGFGNPGTPFSLISELVRQGQTDLTVIKNDANEAGHGISRLIEKRQVRKLITTHIGLNKLAIDRMNQGAIDVEFHPQGILAEKIRTAGAGSFGFLTDIGIDSEITRPEDLVDWKGTAYKVEMALSADFALIHAAQADWLGNLVYRGSAINFSPLMAMAANHVVVETPDLGAPGRFKPEHVHTPGAFVDSVVPLESLTSDYGILEHHVRR
ncbi:CoA transferase subunit A [Saccharospirillum impatiens]|uniref:CoA transferase subunit A n=1 Tax=Saccharospirillum impatiens TaxID=169438 RepID=UPI00041953CF|nr:3-oxoacid CoA-transferase subunit A [Saccharospirillum impatiens]